ncbi:MAG: exosortase A [Planctomycetota bacterium]
MTMNTQLNRILPLAAERQRAASAVVVVVLLVWVLAVYGRTTYSMAAIWERSETFAHGFLIIPIVLFLLWRDRAAIARIEVQPFIPAFLGVAAIGSLWVVASRLNVNSVAQFAMIAMVPCAVWAVLGTPAFKRLGFPLAFLFFAVPFGEFMMPTLVQWTADVTVMALRASGVPVFREGNFFMIPTGRWSVVEACSGLRYLIASFMVGCLFAYLSFRSPLRRAVFVISSVLVPILANWIRAYMIVMLGHLSGNRIAVGADHLLYGWLFFGLVMVVLFTIGARWREDLPPLRVTAAATPAPAALAWPSPQVCVALLTVLAVTAIWPLLEVRQTPRGAIAGERAFDAIPGRNGWLPESMPGSDWRPDIAGATIERTQTFTKDGKWVGLFIAYFGDPSSEAKAITSTNQLVRTINRQWSQVASGIATYEADGGRNLVRTGVVVRERERLAVWQWYWVNGRTTSNDYAAMLYQTLAALRGRAEPVAWVVLYAPAERGEQEAHAVLESFATDMSDPIDAALHVIKTAL